MCGIIAYIGKKAAVPLLIEGLKKLEYRGYDSAGICIAHHNRLEVVKRKGKIAELENVAELYSISVRSALRIRAGPPTVPLMKSMLIRIFPARAKSP
jgi:glucosamine 6-phosphate synthetase-like amidotransferase/phosphosugar isomerase protein